MNNAVTICTLVATAVVVVSVKAYDFKDEEFNNILALNLDEFYDDNPPYSHPRVRRDEDAGKDNCRERRRGKLCCGESLMQGLHEKERDIKWACFQEVFGKDRPEKPRFDPFKCEDAEKRRKEMTCIIQCAGQKQGLLDDDGNLKEEEFGAFLKETFASESWLASVQDEIISTCVSEAKNTAKRDTEGCNPAGVKVVHCLFREIQLNCPADQIKDEESCARLKERLKTQESLLPPPPPGPGDGLDD